MTPEQREELKQAAMNATAGQWTSYETRVYLPPMAGGFDLRGSPNAEANVKHIALANPAAILSLIAQVEALTVPDDYFAPVVLNPTCACAKCNPNAAGRMMILCATCGNKRCPHATDHRLACTDSNELGQPGSSYGPTIPAIPGTKEGA